ncbi:MAG: SDR family NAD(P)-dependent oxidoreductase [Terriglobia bacterium]
MNICRNYMLEGQVALITGSSHGIGFAIARTLAEEGATVVINGRNVDALRLAAEQINQAGAKVAVCPFDVSDFEAVQDGIAEIINTCGRIDVLVNNAGIYSVSPFLALSENLWDCTLAVNLKGVFNCCRLAIPQMLKQKYGRIVNVSSMAAKHGGYLPVAHYASSKAGVEALTKSLAREFAPFGIRINAVSPGVIHTEMAADQAKEKEQMIPMGRLGTAEEVARAILFLVGPDSSYITGEILDVNGGILMD